MRFQLAISQDKIKDLYDMTEEKDFSTIVSYALSLYYTVLKHEVAGHKLAMLPIELDGKFDFERPLVFILHSGNIDSEDLENYE